MEGRVRIGRLQTIDDVSGTLGRLLQQVAQEHGLWAATYRLPEEQVWAPLEWPGGRMYAQVEIDVGYATYRYPERQDRPREALHDMRGRFVFGPHFHFALPKSDYFLNVIGQVVAWVEYWFFYPSNEFNNLHEGDWEGIDPLDGMAIPPETCLRHLAGYRLAQADIPLKRCFFEHVGEPLERDDEHARVGEDDLLGAARGRVACRIAAHREMEFLRMRGVTGPRADDPDRRPGALGKSFAFFK